MRFHRTSTVLATDRSCASLTGGRVTTNVAVMPGATSFRGRTVHAADRSGASLWKALKTATLPLPGEGASLRSSPTAAHLSSFDRRTVAKTAQGGDHVPIFDGRSLALTVQVGAAFRWKSSLPIRAKPHVDSLRTGEELSFDLGPDFDEWAVDCCQVQSVGGDQSQRGGVGAAATITAREVAHRRFLHLADGRGWIAECSERGARLFVLRGKGSAAAPASAPAPMHTLAVAASKLISSPASSTRGSPLFPAAAAHEFAAAAFAEAPVTPAPSLSPASLFPAHSPARSLSPQSQSAPQPQPRAGYSFPPAPRAASPAQAAAQSYSFPPIPRSLSPAASGGRRSRSASPSGIALHRAELASLPHEALPALATTRMTPLLALHPYYTAIFLTAQSSELLVSAVGGAAHDSLRADHVTLHFQPSSSIVAATPIGKRVVVGFVPSRVRSNSRVQAVGVVLGTEMRALCANARPHCTVSVAEFEKGAKASEANGLLIATDGAVETPLTSDETLELVRLHGIVGLVVEGHGAAAMGLSGKPRVHRNLVFDPAFISSSTELFNIAHHDMNLRTIEHEKQNSLTAASFRVLDTAVCAAARAIQACVAAAEKSATDARVAIVHAATRLAEKAQPALTWSAEGKPGMDQFKIKRSGSGDDRTTGRESGKRRGGSVKAPVPRLSRHGRGEKEVAKSAMKKAKMTKKKTTKRKKTTNMATTATTPVGWIAAGDRGGQAAPKGRGTHAGDVDDGESVESIALWRDVTVDAMLVRPLTESDLDLLRDRPNGDEELETTVLAKVVADMNRSEEKLGSTHRDTIMRMNNAALVMYLTDHVEESIEIFLELNDIKGDQGGEARPPMPHLLTRDDVNHIVEHSAVLAEEAAQERGADEGGDGDHIDPFRIVEEKMHDNELDLKMRIVLGGESSEAAIVTSANIAKLRNELGMVHSATGLFHNVLDWCRDDVASGGGGLGEENALTIEISVYLACALSEGGQHVDALEHFRVARENALSAASGDEAEETVRLITRCATSPHVLYSCI